MNLVERAKGIVLKPEAEWAAIEREPGDVQYLFRNYVAILALIPAVAGFIGGSIVGVNVAPFGIVRAPIFLGLLSAAIGYVFSFVIVYVAALIIDALAASFGAQKNFDNALKVATYSNTPYWLVSVFTIVPSLSFLVILGLYGVYLIYLGLPILMKAPKERALWYTAAVFACMLVITLALGGIQAAIVWR
jgi:hypothetical protein